MSNAGERESRNSRSSSVDRALATKSTDSRDSSVATLTHHHHQANGKEKGGKYIAAMDKAKVLTMLADIDLKMQEIRDYLEEVDASRGATSQE